MTDASQGPFSIPTIPDMRLPGGGGELPALGIGMPIGSKQLAPSVVKSAILLAIDLGYRHFQTDISSYLEQHVGESIAEALEKESVTSRNEFFISSKIQFNNAGPESIIPNLRKSLETLKLEYVDMFLIEWPERAEEFSVSEFISSWEAMEQCQSLGLTKLIGVCNFSSQMLESLLKLEKTIPSVNQVGMNPMWKDKELRDFCSANNIIIVVASTIDGKTEDFDFNQFMESESVFKKTEKDLHKTPAQIYLRWAYEQGAALLLESLNEEEMTEILDIFSWELSQEM